MKICSTLNHYVCTHVYMYKCVSLKGQSLYMHTVFYIHSYLTMQIITKVINWKLKFSIKLLLQDTKLTIFSICKLIHEKCCIPPVIDI